MKNFEITRVTLGNPEVEGDVLTFTVREMGGTDEYNGHLPTPEPGSTQQELLKFVVGVWLKDFVGETVMVDEVTDGGFYMLNESEDKFAVYLKR